VRLDLATEKRNLITPKKVEGGHTGKAQKERTQRKRGERVKRNPSIRQSQKLDFKTRQKAIIEAQRQDTPEGAGNDVSLNQEKWSIKIDFNLPIYTRGTDNATARTQKKGKERVRKNLSPGST